MDFGREGDHQSCTSDALSASAEGWGHLAKGGKAASPQGKVP